MKAILLKSSQINGDILQRAAHARASALCLAMKMLRWGRQIAHVQTVTARNRMEEKKRKEGGGEEKDPLRGGMYTTLKLAEGISIHT